MTDGSGDTALQKNALLRMIEMILLFYVLPFIMYYFRKELAFKIIPLGIAAALLCWLILKRDPGFDRKQLWNTGGFRRSVCHILKLFIPGAGVILLFTWYFFPQQFLAFPRRLPGIWFLFMLLYPVLAAFPQELIFKPFFSTVTG